MKNDPDVSLVPNESAFLVAKATELFIESLARESFVHTARAKKKTVQKRDVDLAIGTVDALTFLEGAMDFWAHQILVFTIDFWRNKLERTTKINLFLAYFSADCLLKNDKPNLALTNE